jgi:hypothetical protein
LTLLAGAGLAGGAEHTRLFRRLSTMGIGVFLMPIVDVVILAGRN